MPLRVTLSSVRLGFAALTLAVIITQLVYGLTSVASFSVANFLSFFTIESNMLAMVVLAVVGIGGLRGEVSGRELTLWRGAATLYMAITGLTYSLLLAGLEEALQTQIGWVNFVLHYLMPIVMVVDFLADRTVRPLTFRSGLRWLIYPLVYLVYSLIRGPIVGWYPYPFLDPRPHGYGSVAITSLGILVVGLLLIAVLTWTSRWSPQPRPVDRLAPQ